MPDSVQGGLETGLVIFGSLQRLGQDLAAEEARSGVLATELRGKQDALRAKDQMLKNLQAEAQIARSTIKKMTDLYEKLASGIPTGKPLLVPLPPELDTALKDFAAQYPQMVQYDAAHGVVKFVSDVLFDLGSDLVKPDAVASLRELAKIVGSEAAENFDVVVVGHTDDIRIAKPETTRKHPTNWHLSVHRSISVMNILTDGGVSSEKLGVMGYGEYRPILPNDTNENRAKNRRVEVFLVPRKAVAT